MMVYALVNLRCAGEVGETLTKTLVQLVAADWMAEASEKSPSNRHVPAAGSRCDEADAGSPTSAWTCWLAARSARAAAPPWEPVAPVTRKVWDWDWDMTLVWYEWDWGRGIRS
jgi:hypothetical protein